MKYKEIKNELALLHECEKNCYCSISGKQRFIEFIKNFQIVPKTILDVGGNLGTAKWFSIKFPNSEITILNNSKKEIANYKNILFADAENFQSSKKYDLIFAGEILEHLYNPDGLLASCALSLKSNGYLVITTPNLACIYNRIFLMFGWSLGNYFPSLRLLAGNPFFKDKVGEFGKIADHKSVFTQKALREILLFYGFKIIHFSGYDYGQTNLLKTTNGKYYKLPFTKTRTLLNNLLPQKMKEGMMFICKHKNNTDNNHIQKGILDKRIWES